MTTEKNIHHGRNIKRLREMIGMKQDALALELGEDWTQQRISLLEQKEVVDEPLLQQVAAALKMPAEAIKNFDEEKAIYNIQHNSDTSSNNSIVNYQFNPIDKWIEALEENKKLYERLLQVEREKNELLQKLIKS